MEAVSRTLKDQTEQRPSLDRRRSPLKPCIKTYSQAVMTHAFNLSTQKAEAGGSLGSRLPILQSKFQNSQGYTEKCYYEKPNQTNKSNKINRADWS